MSPLAMHARPRGGGVRAGGKPARGQRAFGLLMVLMFGTISMIALVAALNWSSQTARLNERNNQYFAAVAAAEAATEKVLANMAYDYQAGAASLVAANLASYPNAYPTPAESSYWNKYQFSDGQGNLSRTYVQLVANWSYTNLASQYQGLKGLASRYRIVSNAKPVGSAYDVTGAVRQEVQLASIPVFQFAIFYSIEMEINPGAAMTVVGRVHSNTNIYARPNVSLTFGGDVTAVGSIIPARHPNDPTSPGSGTITYQKAHDGGVASLTLPIATNNSPTAVYAVIGVPPTNELAGSDMGQQRYYNKADLVVLVSNSTMRVTSGALNNFATAIPAAQYGLFLNTNVNFYNKREAKTVKATEIDVAKLVAWSASNTVLRPILGNRDIRSIYIADQRTQTSSTESGVRLVNGQTLGSLGLTVATKNPLYVKGHYNAPSAYLGTTNTTQTKPASLVADAVTVLSPNWSDANASSGLSSRTASSTTVNAAILSGIVPTGIYSGVKQYSGGVENFIRMLEDWGGDTLTYNGSMVIMFYSQIATGLWQGTGSTIGIYNPPTRNWTFDLNYLDSAKLPPGTPELRALIRAEWNTAKANTVN